MHNSVNMFKTNKKNKIKKTTLNCELSSVNLMAYELYSIKLFFKSLLLTFQMNHYNSVPSTYSLGTFTIMHLKKKKGRKEPQGTSYLYSKKTNYAMNILCEEAVMLPFLFF